MGFKFDVDGIANIAGDLSSGLKHVGDNVSNVAGNVVDGASKVGKDTLNAMEDASNAVGNKLNEVKEQTVKAIDQNGNNELEIEDIIILAMKTPGIRVNRDKFLTKELSRYSDKNTIKKVINTNPLKAGVNMKTIDKIADDVIQYERNAVSGISAVLGAPGGAAMMATIPTDLIQYYGHMLKVAQKLLYLYGYPAVFGEDEVILDSGMINILTMCLGVMFGVQGANKLLLKLSNGLAAGVEKKLLKTALTKGTIYPLVKKIATWFNVRMTKQIFAGAAKKAIPVVGAAVGGGLTYVSFKPCCDKLQEVLKDTKLSNENYTKKPDDELIIDVEINEKN